MEKSFFDNVIFVGAKIKTDKGEYRVMAESEGYLMIRKKGRMPFVESRKEVIKWLERQIVFS